MQRAGKPKKHTHKEADLQIFGGRPDDEERYRDWLDQHELGYVVNFKPGRGGMKLHRATCGSINAEGIYYTSSWHKACSLYTPVLREWAKQQTSEGLLMCQHCID